MDCSSGSYYLIHLVRSRSLCCHRNPPPAPIWIVVWVLVNSSTGLCQRKQIPNRSISIDVAREKNNIVVNIANDTTVLARISFLPNASRYKIFLPKNIVKQAFQMMHFTISDTNTHHSVLPQ